MAKPPNRCAMLFVQEHADRKKNSLATVTIVDPPTGKRKRNSWVRKVMQPLLPPFGKCSVRCPVGVSNHGKIQYSRALNPIEGISVFCLSQSEEEKKDDRGRLHWRC